VALLRVFPVLLLRLGASGGLTWSSEERLASACSVASTRDSHLSCLLKGCRPCLWANVRAGTEVPAADVARVPVVLRERLRPLIRSHSAAIASQWVGLTYQRQLPSPRGQRTRNLVSPMSDSCGAACPQFFDKYCK